MSIKFVAEIGLNHNGNFDLCHEMINKQNLLVQMLLNFNLGGDHKKNEINHIDDSQVGQLYKWSKFYNMKFILFSI